MPMNEIIYIYYELIQKPFNKEKNLSEEENRFDKGLHFGWNVLFSDWDVREISLR
jgi:hypothetical protein